MRKDVMKKIMLVAMSLILALPMISSVYAGELAEEDAAMLNGTTESAFAVVSDDYSTLTFYYGTPTAGSYPIAEGRGTGTSGDYPGGVAMDYEFRKRIKTVVFDESFKKYYPESTEDWFRAFESLTSIENISNLNTKNVTNMRTMFWACESLETLDIRSFDTSSVVTMEMMFCEMPNLKKIIVSDLWSLESLGKFDGYHMFASCPQLVGGAGTAVIPWDPNNFRDNSMYSDKYAHIDGGKANPGYLTGDVTVKYDLNYEGAPSAESQNIKPQTILQGSLIEEPAAKPAREQGYTFSGWYRTKECKSGDKWDFSTDKITLDMTLYASWHKEEMPKEDFSDVNYTKWMGPAVRYVTKKGYMTGVSDTEFKPNDPCTREMMVQILYNANGKPAAEGACTFKDAVPGKWYYKALVWGQKEGVASGASADEFGVGKNVSRQELAQFLYNYAKHCGYTIVEGADISSFLDAGDVAGWAKGAMSWANAAKIIKGKAINGTTILDPKGNATRAEVAQMIMNLMENVAK